MLLSRVVSIRNGVFGILSHPHMRTGRTFGQFPFIGEQVFKKIVAPLGRRFGPGYFQTAGNGISSFSGTKTIAPAKALLLQPCRRRLFANVVRRGCTMSLAKTVSARNERNRFF